MKKMGQRKMPPAMKPPMPGRPKTATTVAKRGGKKRPAKMIEETYGHVPL